MPKHPVDDGSSNHIIETLSLEVLHIERVGHGVALLELHVMLNFGTVFAYMLDVGQGRLISV